MYNKTLNVWPTGNSEFCFPLTLNVPLGFRLAEHFGAVIKCSLMHFKYPITPSQYYSVGLHNNTMARHYM